VRGHTPAQPILWLREAAALARAYRHAATLSPARGSGTLGRRSMVHT